MDPETARREARLRFGGEDRFREHARESWGVHALTDFGGDLKFAARQLRKNPGFTALSVATLALGIGGTVALFSVVYGLMLRPLPFPDEDRVVSFWMEYNWRGEEFDYVKGVPESFETVAAYSNDAFTLQVEGETNMVVATVASVELFDMFQVAPLLGRGLQAGDYRAGAEPVVVLSHGLWSTAFGQDRGVIGRRINLSGVQTTVVGVMPAGFYFPSPEMQLFAPLRLDPADSNYANNGWLVLAGRVLEGTTEAQINADLELMTAALGERYDYPTRWDKTRNPFVVPMRDYLLGDVRPALLMLLGAVGLILLMACVNVTALILSRTVDRTREMAVRAALGAGRTRLARQVLTESLLLGIVAGTVGIGLAVVMFDSLVASLPIDAAFGGTLSLDWTALLGALVLSIAAGSLVSLAPIRNLLHGSLPGGTLTERTENAGATRASRVHQGLVVAEVVLAVVLVTGASLLVRTVSALRSLDPGLDPAGVLAVGIILPEEETTPEQSAQFFDDLLIRAHTLPGVQHAGLINRLPLRDGGWQGPVTIADRPDLMGPDRPNSLYRPVTPESFDALGIDIVEGRGILPSDVFESPGVAVINETFARTIWGDESPIGRTFTSGFVGDVEVVGVAEDIAVTELVGAPPMAAFYPWAQSRRGSAYGTLVTKTSMDPNELVAPLRSIARSLESRAAMADITTMEDVMDAEMAEPLRLRFFLTLLSGLGLTLGAIGVYGVVSYSVHRRKTEFGIRMALGAKPTRLVTEVALKALTPVGLGIILGIGVSLLASRALSSFLFGIDALDPVSFTFAGAALAIAGLAAALQPAFRAGSTHPATALRAE